MSRAEKLTLSILGFIATSHIISAAFLGVIGAHTWRQSDTYGHILGFLRRKGFDAFDRFVAGTNQVFDIPIYQLLIAAIAVVGDYDPLVVTRFINAIFWILTAYSGYRLATLLGRPLAGLVFVYLLATSPLILHYYSVPLPDVMALAFSVSAVALLLGGDISWRASFPALPLLIVATLIKSPVPFVLLVFLVGYRGCAAVQNGGLRTFVGANRPLWATLFVLLIVAGAAEQLRSLLTGDASFGLAQSPSDYFGTLEQRLSLGLWGLAGQRLNAAGPFFFSLVYFLVVAIAAFLKPRSPVSWVTLAAVIAFFVGWLTFTELYAMHDYYQLPGTVVMFLSFAVAVSLIVDEFVDGRSAATRRAVATVVTLAAIPLAAVQMLTQDTLSNRVRASFFTGIEFALRDQDLVLYVHDLPVRENPGFGGVVGTKFEQTDTQSFERNCEAFVRSHAAIFVNGASRCLAAHRGEAKYFIEDAGLTFYLRR